MACRLSTRLRAFSLPGVAAVSTCVRSGLTKPECSCPTCIRKMLEANGV